MLVVSEAQSGKHNDLYELETLFKEMIEVLEQADISCKVIFLNADPGFDSEEFRTVCQQNDIELNVKENKRNKKQEDDCQYRYFDEKLYKSRTKIERANAWMGAFKALLVRYGKLIATWMGLQWLALVTLFCRKLKV